ncbi:uncharacterized protein LOC119115089 [Syngnathus acus]|uniref:uncharacterized protein LOC119115089 n=1 Tax=Syngnathus acus TaxID=161584 RepID=UPI0018862C8C|nr:uncharacterized protein LOC119115089 [Syngnathus acus]
MNFSKLLCLVLVYIEQFGRALECKGVQDGSKDCEGKQDEQVKLIIQDTENADTTWLKGLSPVSTQANKYTIVNDPQPKSLTILSLEEADEGTYKAAYGDPVKSESFNVKVIPVCKGSSTKTKCKGKSGGKLTLEAIGIPGPITWVKGSTTITESGTKYGPVNQSTLLIKELAELDQADYKATGTGSSAQEFAVQVAPVYMGSTETPKPCVGNLDRDIVLKIGGSVSNKEVVWTKGDVTLTGVKYVKSGNDESVLKITNLAANDAGEYKAVYNDPEVTEIFILEVKSVTPDNDKAPPGGGTKKPSDDGGTKKPSDGGGPKKPRSGGGGNLSYSPALLVTVILVHLLLQLAA